MYNLGLPNNSASEVIQKLLLLIILIDSTWVFPIGILSLFIFLLFNFDGSKFSILIDLKKRDNSDKSRKNSPLILSKDSIFIDTEFLNPHQVLKKALNYIKKSK